MASSPQSLADRLVRYDALVPCLNAFIDTRSPGSEAKENFTIIGPGVSEIPTSISTSRRRTASISAARASRRIA